MSSRLLWNSFLTRSMTPSVLILRAHPADISGHISSGSRPGRQRSQAGWRPGRAAGAPASEDFDGTRQALPYPARDPSAQPAPRKAYYHVARAARKTSPEAAQGSRLARVRTAAP
jgi:hypothetical protein